MQFRRGSHEMAPALPAWQRRPLRKRHRATGDLCQSSISRPNRPESDGPKIKVRHGRSTTVFQAWSSEAGSWSHTAKTRCETMLSRMAGRGLSAGFNWDDFGGNSEKAMFCGTSPTFGKLTRLPGRALFWPIRLMLVSRARSVQPHVRRSGATASSPAPARRCPRWDGDRAG